MLTCHQAGFSLLEVLLALFLLGFSLSMVSKFSVLDLKESAVLHRCTVALVEKGLDAHACKS